ncbi:MAG: enoyl-CoA hydratase/isomerase family protein [Lysobacter sp.]|nr:enoyl-CoA hydratase/isomerase family protein [Lysobacter sp.]
MSLLENISPITAANLVRCETDEANRTDWMFMHANTIGHYHPCFSERLLNEMKREQEALRRRLASIPSENTSGIHHLVLASDENVFNLGGDLSLFANLIRTGNRGRLLDYAKLCVEVAYNLHRLYENQVHSIAVVQGDALGGGFEAALCCHTIIAEEGTGMGFPEVLFDLFPGMGAYTFLTRRVSPIVAERMMLDARTYSAEELFSMGIVDQVVPKGTGLRAASELIRKHQRIGNALRSMNAVRQASRPVTLNELQAVPAEWVDAAMRLNERGLRAMERLIRAQQRRAEQQPIVSAVG